MRAVRTLPPLSSARPTGSRRVPVSGRFSQCGRVFTTAPDADDPGLATHDFYVAFESHDCQAAGGVPPGIA
jgi:hypothetical protein